MRQTEFDVIIVGGSFSGAAAAKRLVDAGFDTLVIERLKLPRHKPCSGIISPRGHRFLLENFGPLPKEALHDPATCRGVTFHYPKGVSMPMDFHFGSTPHLDRKHSDHWALTRSGAAVHDETRFTGLQDMSDHVRVHARSGHEDIEYKARYVVGADGPNSRVVRALYPGYEDTIPWFAVKQFMHEIIDCPLDSRYFHFWVNPDLGYYTWSHLRNGRQIVGVGFEATDDLMKRHGKVMRYLEEHHGVRLGPADHREGSVNNFGPSLINRYVFGKGNVLVTGQAAGFLNMIAEGMSAALHSGAIAGEAIIEAERYSMGTQRVYREMVSSEVRRCSDQWNPFKIIWGKPHEADFMATLKRMPKAEQRMVWRGTWEFIKPWARFKWGRQILKQGIIRYIQGAYSPARWL